MYFIVVGSGGAVGKYFRHRHIPRSLKRLRSVARAVRYHMPFVLMQDEVQSGRRTLCDRKNGYAPCGLARPEIARLGEGRNLAVVSA